MRLGQHHSETSKENLRRKLKLAAKKGLLTGRPRKDPIYTLPHGIVVLSEYKSGKYVICYLEQHRFFPNSKVYRSGQIYVQRSRVVMSSLLGRSLGTNEHVHHKKHDQTWNDSPDNLELLNAVEHNRHHHVGLVHSEKIKKQISESLRRAYSEGLRSRPKIVKRDRQGRIVRCICS